MAFQYDDLIGTGETYTTISAWESARNVSEAWTGDRRGRCKAENFGGAFMIGLGNDDTTNTYWLVLTSDSGAEHDGRAHEVSGAGNARIDSSSGRVVSINDSRIEVSWLEIRGASGTAADGVKSAGDNTCRVHHNVIHKNQSGNNADCVEAEGDGMDVYRNILYGPKDSGANGKCVRMAAGSPDVMNCLHNTGFAATDEGLDDNGGNSVCKANCSFDSASDDVKGWLTEDDNATSDATGDAGAGLTNLTSSNEVKNPTTTWANTDLRIKDNTATIYQAGSETFSTATYPEIDVPITARGTSITGDWSIGADDIVAGDVTYEHTKKTVTATKKTHGIAWAYQHGAAAKTATKGTHGTGRTQPHATGTATATAGTHTPTVAQPHTTTAAAATPGSHSIAKTFLHTVMSVTASAGTHIATDIAIHTTKAVSATTGTHGVLVTVTVAHTLKAITATKGSHSGLITAIQTATSITATKGTHATQVTVVFGHTNTPVIASKGTHGVAKAYIHTVAAKAATTGTHAPVYAVVHGTMAATASKGTHVPTDIAIHTKTAVSATAGDHVLAYAISHTTTAAAATPGTHTTHIIILGSGQGLDARGGAVIGPIGITI